MEIALKGSLRVDQSKKIIIQHLKQFVRRGSFVLSGGAKAETYIDVKAATLADAYLIGEHVFQAIPTPRGMKHSQTLLTTELGGALVLVATLSWESHLDGLVLRKQDKTHGIKGRLIGDYQKGSEVVLIDDVATSGGSLADMATFARRELKVKPAAAVVVVDRGMGAAERLKSEFGIELISIVKGKEIIG